MPAHVIYRAHIVGNTFGHPVHRHSGSLTHRSCDWISLLACLRNRRCSGVSFFPAVVLAARRQSKIQSCSVTRAQIVKFKVVQTAGCIRLPVLIESCSLHAAACDGWNGQLFVCCGTLSSTDTMCQFVNWPTVALSNACICSGRDDCTKFDIDARQ
jgi:hypothetical protein